MIKAVISDLDGVIVETEHIHIQAEKLALLKYGVKISGNSTYNGCFGNDMSGVPHKCRKN